MNNFATLAISLAALALTGCGAVPKIPFVGDSDKPKRETYIDLEPQPALKVPDDLQMVAPGQVLSVPEVGVQMNASYYPDRPPRPDAKYASDNRDEVRMQRLGDRNWLVIPESPTTAWPKMKQFFADNGIVLEADRPELGRLNTAWLVDDGRPVRDIVRSLVRQARSEAGLETGDDRFLIRVEQGLQPQSTEVHLRHDNDKLGQTLPADMVRVQDASSDLVAAEKALLEQIGGYVAARVAESTVSKVALQIGSQPKTEMRRNSEGIPELSFFLDKSRTVASLTQSLRNAGVLIDSEDSDAGRFDITIPKEVLTGRSESRFLCRVTFSCGASSGTNVTLLMSEAVETGKGEAHKIFVLENGQLMTDADRAQEILVLIREYAT